MNFASDNPYAPDSMSTAAFAVEEERTAFLRQTYSHLAGAILGFALVEFMIFSVVPSETLNGIMAQLANSQYGWLIVLGAFMAVSWIADSWARSSTSRSMQYAGLALYVVAEAVIFVPLLYTAISFSPNAISTAVIMTTVMFGGLTVMVFVTRADFSWMGRWLCIAGFAVMGTIVCSILFGFQLGTLFIGALIVFACASILYQTSNILHHYRTDQYVAAALSLFASVALLFYYVLMLLVSRD